MKAYIPRHSIRLAVAVSLLGLAGGCSTPRASKEVPSVFYPPLPAAPRLQFLTSYSKEEDLGRRRNRFLYFLIGKTPPARPVVKPYGATLSADKIYVCDTVPGSLAVFDLDVRRLTHWATEGEDPLQIPINLAVGPDGTLYVADAKRGQVLMYNPSGTYLGFIGDAEGMKPTDVAVAADRLYVTDLEHHLVSVHDRVSGGRLFTIPREPHRKEAKLFSPTNIALDSEGNLYVTDSGAFRIQKYAADGTYLQGFGTHGDAPGQFAMPKGIAVDRQGRVYVVDAAMQVVQIFNADGQLLMFFGEPGGGEVALNLPAAVSIDYDHVDRFREYADPDFELEYLVLVTSQYGTRKINVFGFGHTR